MDGGSIIFFKKKRHEVSVPSVRNLSRNEAIGYGFRVEETAM
jgi:hypothetical protein